MNLFFSSMEGVIASILTFSILPLLVCRLCQVENPATGLKSRYHYSIDGQSVDPICKGRWREKV